MTGQLALFTGMRAFAVSRTGAKRQVTPQQLRTGQSA